LSGEGGTSKGGTGVVQTKKGRKVVNRSRPKGFLPNPTKKAASHLNPYRVGWEEAPGNGDYFTARKVGWKKRKKGGSGVTELTIVAQGDRQGRGLHCQTAWSQNVEHEK